MGGGKAELSARRVECRRMLREFWKGVGETKRDGPSVRDMAERTGLVYTYEYIYFLSSNFVHFNPLTLMRMGWGPNEGPFRFSVHNFSKYYLDVASFYGAVIMLGFYFRVGQDLFAPGSHQAILDLLESIDEVPRWPEIITYEELNRKPPILHFMARALRKATEDSEENVPYGAILKEVRGIS